MESRTAAGKLFQTAGAETAKVQGVRPMQDGSSTRAQRPRRLMTVQFTCQIAQDTSAHSPQRNGAEFEIDTFANQQPVQVLPKLSDVGKKMKLLYYHTSERVLDTLNTAEVAL